MAAGGDGLSVLIERLEVATEGSRELNWMIARAIRKSVVPADLLHLEERHGGPELHFLDSLAHKEGFCLGVGQPYTTSLDAALTLVPEGWRLHNLSDGYERASACLHRAFGAEEDELIWRVVHHWPQEHNATARASTKPLALCIAALKARQQDKP